MLTGNDFSCLYSVCKPLCIVAGTCPDANAATNQCSCSAGTQTHKHSEVMHFLLGPETFLIFSIKSCCGSRSQRDTKLHPAPPSSTQPLLRWIQDKQLRERNIIQCSFSLVGLCTPPVSTSLEQCIPGSSCFHPGVYELSTSSHSVRHLFLKEDICTYLSSWTDFHLNVLVHRGQRPKNLLQCVDNLINSNFHEALTWVRCDVCIFLPPFFVVLWLQG